MTLVQAWVDSVSLLKPKNLKLFLLVTLKSIIEAYKLVFVYWSWLIALIGAYIFIAPYFVGYGAIAGYLGLNYLYQMLLFGICLSTRPSIMQKDCAYFRSYAKYFIYTAIFLIFFLIPFLFTDPLMGLGFSLSGGYVFSLLFFLDSKKQPKDFVFSLWYAFKMVIFNFPLVTVFQVSLYIAAYSFCYYTSFSFATYFLISALLMPIPVCTYTNIYIKKLHDQFDLYFTQPK